MRSKDELPQLKLNKFVLDAMLKRSTCEDIFLRSLGRIALDVYF